MNPAQRFAAGLFAVLLASLALAADALSAPAAPQVTGAEAQSLVEALEDPDQRQRLVEQLRLLAAAGEAEAEEPPSPVRGATAQLMRSVSQRLAVFREGLQGLTDLGRALPRASAWLQEAAAAPEARSYWLQVAARLLAVVVAAYVAGALATWLLGRPRKALRMQQAPNGLLRLLGLTGLLLLELVPIAAFAAGAYLTLTAVDAREETRVVALALVNAALAVRLAAAAANLVLAPETPRLRLTGLTDETAHYLAIWLRRIAATLAYGFLGLQAALLLGLEPVLYTTLLNLLGLLILGMLLVLVFQSREGVARALRGPDDGVDSPLRLLRRRLAQTWHLLAAAYLMVLFGIWALKVSDGFTYVLKATVLSILALVLTRMLLRLADGLFGRWQHLDQDLRQRFPLLQARVNRYLPVLQTGLHWVIYALAVLAVLEAWGVDAFAWAASEPSRTLAGTLLRVLAIVGVAVVLWEVTAAAVERYLAETDSRGRPQARSARARTLLTVARNALLVVLVVVASLMVLSELGLNIGPLLAGAGVLGLAIGFGAQRLVQDVITGVFILLQDLMSVGDVVKLGDKAGLVEAITIRTVRLRDLSGTVHTIPFSAIDTVSNLTKDFSFYVFDLGVAYREDVDEVMAIITEVGEELQQDPEIGPLILEPVEIFGVDAFADSAVVIKGRLKTQPIKQWAVGRAFNRRIKQRFDERGIEIPFPHRTLYFGVDKTGGAPPVPLPAGRHGRPGPVDLLRDPDTVPPAPEPSETPTPETD